MEKFYFITHDNFDPYFNLASEEYLLKVKKLNCIYLWRNAPAVIVGVNQNAIEEVNLSFTNKNGIKVVRRLTGGGAVYHDKNNVCYTVIAPYVENENHYVKFTTPVIEYLKTLGISAEFSGRNDILVDGKKISGNAQTVSGDRIMHHGTLLFDTDTNVLTGALKPNKLKIESKGIKSVRSRVSNIKNLLKNEMSIEQFTLGLKNYMAKNLEEYRFTKSDIESINELVKTKYSTYDWNIGSSPKGNLRFSEKFPFGIIDITFSVINGKIENASIYGDFFEKKPITEFANALNGCVFKRDCVEKAFANVSEYINGANGQEIVDKIFN